MAKKTTKPKKKLIDIMHAAFEEAGYVVERGGWTENEHSVPPNDRCEWLDVSIKNEQPKHGDVKNIFHFYFSNNSTKFDHMELFRSKYKLKMTNPKKIV